MNAIQFANDRWNHCAGDRKALERLLIKTAEKDRELHDDLIAIGAYEVCCEIAANARQIIAEGRDTQGVMSPRSGVKGLQRGTSGESLEKIGRGIHLSAKMHEGDWLKWPMSINGNTLFLGEAKRDQVEEVARRYVSDGRGKLVRGAFLSRVAKRLNEKQRVREVLNNEQLSRIYRNVEKKEGAK